MQRTVMLGDRQVTRIGLGTNRLTYSAGNVAFIQQAVEAGVGVLDTAFTYAGGDSETTIGAALGAAKGPLRDSVIVATKGGMGAGNGAPDVLRSQIETSLRRLRTDAIDLYYLHRIDPQTPLEDSVGAIKEYLDAGKIQHLGLSQVSVEQIERARAIAPIAAVENQYNLSERGWDAVVDYCTRERILFVPYFPLHGEGGTQLSRIAETHGATPSQIALAWLLRRSPQIVPIPGTLSIAHVRENLAALEIELTDDEFEALA